MSKSVSTSAQKAVAKVDLRHCAETSRDLPERSAPGGPGEDENRDPAADAAPLVTRGLMMRSSEAL